LCYNEFKMTREQKSPASRTKPPNPDLKYRRVEITAIKKGRRGKHYELVEGILKELVMAPPGSAIQVPLADVGGIGLAKLRSAVHRASMSRQISIETLADENNFYVWNANTRER
jgi:hypothetical protein